MDKRGMGELSIRITHVSTKKSQRDGNRGHISRFLTRGGKGGDERMGSIYRRGKIWWVKYFRHGKPYYESSRSEKESDAKDLLRLREGEIAQGKPPGINFDRVYFDDLARDMLADYRNKEQKSIGTVENHIEHLKKIFEGCRVPNITTSNIQKYIDRRLGEGASRGTVNNELRSLRRMLNLGARRTPPKVDRVPYIPMQKANSARKGFFEHGDFLALRDQLPDYLKGFATFGYKSGWRFSEICTLTWSQVDLENGIVVLNPGETKNDEARSLYLDDELQGVFLQQWEKRKKSGILLPWVFPNRKTTGRIVDIRKAWGTACREAKIGKRFFHDFRRTAVRNMVRAGIPERVAMMVSGHRTRAIFERYNIVNDNDLKMAAEKYAQYIERQDGYKTVTISDFKQREER
jgi:integrase